MAENQTRVYLRCVSPPYPVTDSLTRSLCSRVTPGPPELHFLFSPTRKSPRQGTPPPRHRRQQQREQGRNCGTTRYRERRKASSAGEDSRIHHEARPNFHEKGSFVLILRMRGNSQCDWMMPNCSSISKIAHLLLHVPYKTYQEQKNKLNKVKKHGAKTVIQSKSIKEEKEFISAKKICEQTK